MLPTEIVRGQQQHWGLINKLGEGDAGEVYLVESLLEKRRAILKRPHRSAFASEALRQATQIEREGKILRALGGITTGGEAGCLRAPRLIDQSGSGSEYSERFFIIIEKAQGFDLSTLAKAGRLGFIPEMDLSLPEQAFLHRVTTVGRIPRLIILRGLAVLIDYFEKIHPTRVSPAGFDQAGILWNDVKPEHLFWDPEKGCFTIIDWGNGQFLEGDGATKDRRNSVIDDYYQFIVEFGRFLADYAPELYAELEWPENISPGNAYTEGIKVITERITVALEAELKDLQSLRQQETGLVTAYEPQFAQFRQLEKIQAQILDYGEIPDWSGAEAVAARLASSLATQGDMLAFCQVCEQASGIPTSEPQQWRVLGKAGSVASRGGLPKDLYATALLAGLSRDWPSLLWDMLSTVQDHNQPSWAEDLATLVRQAQIGPGADALLPYTAVSRLMHTLQAAAMRLGDTSNRNRTSSSPNHNPSPNEDQVKAYETITRALREEVVAKWKQLEPDPPFSGLAYQDIDSLLDPIEVLLPGTRQSFQKTLEQPKTQARLVLDAWERMDFETARRGLRSMLLWDPDRRRVFLAERAILDAASWLRQIMNGPDLEESLHEYVTRVELRGREMRNQVGPASWLDLGLEALACLRKNGDLAGLMLDRPELRTEMPWLEEAGPRRPVPLPAGPISLERAGELPAPEQTVYGVRECLLGGEGEILLGDPLDTWAPEARGSSARVFAGFLRTPAGQLRQAAVKVMRPGQAAYALPLFREEIQILTLLQNVPGMTPLLECGFIQLGEGQSLPGDERTQSARQVTGEAVRYSQNDVHNFLAVLDNRTLNGWLPYIAIEKRNREDNLMMLCDAGYTHGRFLSLQESLRMAIQILDIMQIAHTHNIVYRDHKILHYFWDEVFNGIFMIDWNVARLHSEGLSKAEKTADIVQFGARALHHILTGRPAPGALPIGPNRPEEIERAAQTYQVQWTYDDQRLPDTIKEILASVLSGSYAQANRLREDLAQIFFSLPGTVSR